MKIYLVNYRCNSNLLTVLKETLAQITTYGWQILLTQVKVFNTVKDMADRVIILKKGELIFNGNTEEEIKFYNEVMK